jgi:membrane protease YdiL (CAAX protease family)
MSARLWAWLVFVGIFAVVSYAANFTGSEPKGYEPLYHYGTAVGGGVTYAVLLGIALAIAVGTSWRDLFALLRPRTKWTWLGPIVLLVGVLILNAILDPVLHPGKEQGLVPSHWQSRYAGPYAANAVVVVLVAPVVEELIFRGMGYSLLVERFGRAVAIVAVGLAFGLAHGLVDALPLLAALGAGLAWLRSKTGSVYPGMATHAIFNGIAVLSVIVR